MIMTTVAHVSRARQASVQCESCGQVNFSGELGAAGTCTFQGCFKVERGSTRCKQQSLTARLQSYGYAGVASYGLLNTAYYITAFLIFWTRVAKVPKGLGLAEAAKRFVGVMSLTWAGSQVTKVARIGAALALAPLVDAACSWAQQKLGLKSQRTALSLVITLCFGLAALCFGGTVLLWA
ncbi:hypothetical protein ABBQ32_011380 [Trebouxia sp. C0010 RCD-2024]